MSDFTELSDLENKLGMAKKKITTREDVSARLSRRKLLYITVIFCFGIIAWTMWSNIGLSTCPASLSLFETIVISAFGLAGTVIIGYMGAGTYQDTNVSKFLTILKAREDSLAENRPKAKKKKTDDSGELE